METIQYKLVACTSSNTNTLIESFQQALEVLATVDNCVTPQGWTEKETYDFSRFSPWPGKCYCTMEDLGLFPLPRL